MKSPSSPSRSGHSTYRPCLLLLTLGVALTAAGCTPRQIKSLIDSAQGSSESNRNAAPEMDETGPPVAAEVTPGGAAGEPADAAPPSDSFYVDPGTGLDVELLAGFRMTPPETFNVIEEEEGSDFHATYKHFRWSRLSGGAWFIVTFLSGLDYEGPRAPKVLDKRAVAGRIKTAFARIDANHQLRSNGSQVEQLAGLATMRTNVIGQVNGQEAIGHLYALYDGKHLIEIVALATVPHRDALKICRESANSLSRNLPRDR